MSTVVRDLRRSGPIAKVIGVSACAVVVAGAVTAAIRSGPSGSGTPTGPVGWVRVVDREVGFIARLPAAPKNYGSARSVGGTQLEVWQARAGHRIVIDRFAIPDVSSTGLERIFREAVDSLARGSGFLVQSQGPTTFRGQPARAGAYVADDGSSYRAIIFADGAGDLYFIGAPGRYYDAVTTSFRVLIPQSRPLRR